MQEEKFLCMDKIDNAWQPSYLTPQVKVITLNVRRCILDASVTGDSYKNEQMDIADGWGSDFF